MSFSNPRKLAIIVALIAAVGITARVAFQFVEEDKPQWLPYGGRGRVSNFLLDLMEGPKGLDSIFVPAGFEVELAAGPDLVNYGVFFAFDDRGRLFVCESAGKNMTDEEALAEPSFRIRVLEDVDGDGRFDRGKIFADKITMALGVQWYQGSLYVAAPPDVLRFEDVDGDGVADRREVIMTGWPIKSNATTLHGPYMGPDGWMYLTYSPQAYKITTKEGTVLEGPRGRVFRMRPDGTRLEWFVGGGFDNPVEVVFNTAGETIGTNTYYSNPKNGVRDSLLHYIDGGIYPKWRPYVDTAYQRTGDFLPAVTKFARVAPSGLELYRSAVFGEEYQGNLFSAQFNPHRVQRHILRRVGGTFESEDQDFLTSTDIDLHLTDVVEDADGSLLVLDTGAWYLHSCPVSRIAKPEYTGAIYRIRKSRAPRIDDPWGNELNIASLPPEQLTPLLEDSRFKVRDRALDYLIRAGAGAVESLAAFRRASASATARAAAVFGLGRIVDARAAGAVREALTDADLEVRIAAARMAGLNEDPEAVEPLAKMVTADEPAARRQAAEALGRIGDPSAVAALIEASADPEDRFVEHAVIYALIRLESSEPLMTALGDRRPAVRKAALIALDQMNGKPLRREHLLALLGAKNESLANGVLWVVGQHPEWSSDVGEFLRSRLAARNLSDDQAAAIRPVLVAFCEDSGTQQLTADLLADPKISSQRKVFLLDSMNNCAMNGLPASWLNPMSELLDGGDGETRAEIVALAASRGVGDFDSQLARIAGGEAETPELRTAALSALAARTPQLAESSFQFLTGLLRSETPADLRLSAAHVLAKSDLSSDQLLAVAGDLIPRGDVLVLPTLLDAFADSRDANVGGALIAGLLDSSGPVGSVAGERLQSLLENFPPEVRSQADPLLNNIRQEDENRAARLAELKPLLTAAADVGRGRNLFFGRKAACSSCHTIGDEGENVGPDLTAVGSVRSGLDILEAIVFPSASFVPGHEVYRVETARDVYSGVRGESTRQAVVIISGPRERIRIPREEIVSMEPSTVSLMPDGFDQDLTSQELTDLLAFLQAQTSRDSALRTD